MGRRAVLVFAAVAAASLVGASRTASYEASFFLPHLRSGIRLLDVGCGPSSH
jgi:hypothetical protein